VAMSVGKGSASGEMTFRLSEVATALSTQENYRLSPRPEGNLMLGNHVSRAE